MGGTDGILLCCCARTVHTPPCAVRRRAQQWVRLSGLSVQTHLGSKAGVRAGSKRENTQFFTNDNFLTPRAHAPLSTEQKPSPQTDVITTPLRTLYRLCSQVAPPRQMEHRHHRPEDQTEWAWYCRACGSRLRDRADDRRVAPTTGAQLRTPQVRQQSTFYQTSNSAIAGVAARVGVRDQRYPKQPTRYQSQRLMATYAARASGGRSRSGRAAATAAAARIAANAAGPEAASASSEQPSASSGSASASASGSGAGSASAGGGAGNAPATPPTGRMLAILAMGGAAAPANQSPAPAAPAAAPHLQAAPQPVAADAAGAPVGAVAVAAAPAAEQAEQRQDRQPRIGLRPAAPGGHGVADSETDDDGDNRSERGAERRGRSRSPSPSSRLARWNFAGEVLASLREAGGVSAHYYVTTITFRSATARNECLQLGLFIDAYLAMEVGGNPLPDNSPLLDLMCRRLVGVLQADEHNNWSLAEATKKTGASRLAGADLFTALAKAANSYDRVKKAATKGQGSGGHGLAGGDGAYGKRKNKGRGGRGSGKNHNPSGSGSAANNHVQTGGGANRNGAANQK